MYDELQLCNPVVELTYHQMCISATVINYHNINYIYLHILSNVSNNRNFIVQFEMSYGIYFAAAATLNLDTRETRPFSACIFH